MKTIFKILHIIRFCFFSGLILISLGSVAGMFLVFYMAKDLPKLPSPLSRIIETPQSQILASNGQLLLSLGERKTVPLDMVSQDFINAIIATEDHRFFEHKGINKLRTLKGLYITLSGVGKVQGASTITQQLAKNLFFSFKQTFTRKFRELLVAIQIEASSTKQEILQAYINQIYFGAGAQGVEKAANVFFGKSALDLTLSEAALLAGLPKSPSNYNPYRYYDRALERRNIVLRRMIQVGFISESQAQKASLEKPELYHERTDSRTGNYFLDALISELIQLYGEDVIYHGGIKVFSTEDPRLQAYAKAALKTGLVKLDDLLGIKSENDDHPQGALVSVEVGTGAVRALVGGRDYHQSEYNRAVKSRRQPGSGFKPFLYYAAFKNLGYHPATLMTDKPVIISVAGSPDWMPQNFNKVFDGDMILKKALIDSVNSVAAQLVEKTGPSSVNQVARLCGIKSPLADVNSVALGTSGITPLEMASAYAVFATMGVRHEPYLFKRVEDAFGHVIYEHIIQEKRVLEAATTYQLVDMMEAVIDQGSGNSIRKMGFEQPAAGKTGTTDGYNDAWFTGFTPTLSTSVWTGFDKNTRMVDMNHAGITGGRIAAPIWAEFMTNALKSDPERDFPIPDNIRFETVNIKTGCNFDSQNDGAAGLTVALKPDQRLCGKEEE